MNVPPIRPEYIQGSDAKDVADNSRANIEANTARADILIPLEFLRQNSDSAWNVPVFLQCSESRSLTGTYAGLNWREYRLIVNRQAFAVRHFRLHLINPLLALWHVCASHAAKPLRCSGVRQQSATNSPPPLRHYR